MFSPLRITSAGVTRHLAVHIFLLFLHFDGSTCQWYILLSQVSKICPVLKRTSGAADGVARAALGCFAPAVPASLALVDYAG